MRLFLLAFRIAAFLFVLYPNYSVAAQQSLSITTSIQPLGLILSELTQNTSATIHVLIPANQSSHDFSLRPKDIMSLSRSDLVIWLGPELEHFFQKPIEQLAKTKSDHILTLLTAPNIKKQLLPLRSGAQWQDPHHHHEDEDHHETTSIDPHIWLSPKLMLEMARLITKKLIALNPAEANIYFTNFKRLASQLILIDKAYRQAFIQSTHRYLVLHDSYQYLEKSYHLPITGVLAIHPDRPSSIKMLREAQQRIAQDQVSCILSEAPFHLKLIEVLLEELSGKKPKVVQLWPLADSFELKAGNYQAWQLQMLKSIQNCE